MYAYTYIMMHTLQLCSFCPPQIDVIIKLAHVVDEGTMSVRKFAHTQYLNGASSC